MYTLTHTLMCVYIMAIATTKRGAGERGRSRERDAIFQCFICSPFSFAYTYTFIYMYFITLYYIILRATRRHIRSFFLHLHFALLLILFRFFYFFFAI